MLLCSLILKRTWTLLFFLTTDLFLNYHFCLRFLKKCFKANSVIFKHTQYVGKFQSVLGHITEMAFLRVLNDLLLTADSGSSAVLVLLNLFAAFDTVDRKILLSRLVYVASRV